MRNDSASSCHRLTFHFYIASRLRGVASRDGGALREGERNYKNIVLRFEKMSVSVVTSDGSRVCPIGENTDYIHKPRLTLPNRSTARATGNSVDEHLGKNWRRALDRELHWVRNFFQACEFQMALLRVNPKVPAPVRCKSILYRAGQQLSDTREPVRIPEHDFCFAVIRKSGRSRIDSKRGHF
jgi:hypothetical protein